MACTRETSQTPRRTNDYYNIVRRLDKLGINIIIIIIKRRNERKIKKSSLQSLLYYNIIKLSSFM